MVLQRKEAVDWGEGLTIMGVALRAHVQDGRLSPAGGEKKVQGCPKSEHLRNHQCYEQGVIADVRREKVAEHPISTNRIDGR